jgi:molecular chaperone DnaK (HSP70)
MAQEDGIFEVLSTSSDRHLGGQDFSSRLLDHLLSMFEAKPPGKVVKAEVQKDARAMGALRKAVEVAKKALSTEMSTQVEIERFHGGEDLRQVVTRVEFEELNADLFERITRPIGRALEDAKLKQEDIDEVLAHHCLSIDDPDVSLLYQVLFGEGRRISRKCAKWYRTILARSHSSARYAQTRPLSMVLLSKLGSSAVTWTAVGARVST